MTSSGCGSSNFCSHSTMMMMMRFFLLRFSPNAIVAAMMWKTIIILSIIIATTTTTQQGGGGGAQQQQYAVAEAAAAFVPWTGRNLQQRTLPQNGLLSCFTHALQPRMITSTTTAVFAIQREGSDEAGSSGSTSSSSGSTGSSGSNMNSSDFPPAEELMTNTEYKGSVDWDAEWKKVVQNGGTSVKRNKVGTTERPGKDFYKSETEIAAIRAANKATESVTKLASQIPSPPSFDRIKGDWKFWIGLLAVLSFGSALLTAQVPMSSAPPTGSSESYYI